MANPQVNQDLDLGEERSSKNKLIIIIAIVAVLLIGGGIASYFLFSGGDEAEVSAESAGDKNAIKEEKGAVQYHAMAPAFVINLPGHPSLLQIGLTARVYSDVMVEFLKHNDPMIRHHLLNLLQGQNAQALQESSAKKALQKELLKELNRIVKELSGPGEVDAVFFTSFVMQ